MKYDKKIMRGITFQIVIGKWSRPSIRWSKQIYGICLGWIAISIIPKDMEVFFSLVVRKMIEQQRQLDAINKENDQLH